MKLRLAAALGAAVFVLAACGNSSDTGTATAAAPPATSAAAESPSADVVSPSAAADSPSTGGSPSDVTCAYQPDGTASKDVGTPPTVPTLTGDVPLTISTSVGDLVGTLNADTTPCTVNSFAYLAEAGYFDDTTCHRLVTSGIYVLQCGDPDASGMGGPGYAFADELSGSETYPAGTLAMANAGPNTNGSQFFIVYADTQLPPSYTVFGSVDTATVGLVETVAQAGNADDGVAPATPVDISGVTIGG